MAWFTALSLGSTLLPKIKGLFKSKAFWAVIGIGLLLFAGWYMQSRIETLAADLATAEQQVDQVTANNEALETTITEIDKRLTEVKQAQERLDATRDQLQEQLNLVRQQLQNIDIERNPQQAAEQLRTIYVEQLECIEYASGNEQAQCQPLTEQQEE